jgi:hypothetical protein
VTCAFFVGNDEQSFLGPGLHVLLWVDAEMVFWEINCTSELRETVWLWTCMCCYRRALCSFESLPRYTNLTLGHFLRFLILWSWFCGFTFGVDLPLSLLAWGWAEWRPPHSWRFQRARKRTKGWGSNLHLARCHSAGADWSGKCSDRYHIYSTDAFKLVVKIIKC